MKKLKITTFLTVFFICFNVSSANDDDSYNSINSLIDQENYFKAKEVFDSNIGTLTDVHVKFFEIILDNAFNKPKKSHEEAVLFINGLEPGVSRELLFKVYEIEADNAFKLFDYKRAKAITNVIINEYKSYLTEDELDDNRNNLKIYNVLENVPPQKVDIRAKTVMKMTKDVAGLKNLKICIGNDSENFIFDTGANLSCIIESVAKRFKMKIIPAGIEVGTTTGHKISADLAVCPKLTLGNIDVYNSIFIVFPDEQLFFSRANYQIYGILGFPVIEAFKEIHITKDCDFIVPKKETEFSEASNMALDGLFPLVFFNQKHFTFDTGADSTMLYHNYYLENKQEIDNRYKPQKVAFAGAGGKKEFDGFIVDYEFNILGKKVTVNDIQLLKEAVDDETVYGNIGQDLIGQFDEMILSFSQMHLTFR